MNATTINRSVTPRPAARLLRKGDHFAHRDIRIAHGGDTLELAVGGLRRLIDLAQGVPITRSLGHDDDGPLATANAACDFSFAGINLPGGPGVVRFAPPRCRLHLEPASWRDGEHVRLEVTLRERVQGVTFVRAYLLYPGLPVLAVETALCSDVSPNLYWAHRRRLANDLPPEMLESCADSLTLAAGFAARRSVEFRGRTDYADNPVTVHRLSPEARQACGNLLFCENDRGGLFFLQEAPPSSERRDFEEHDFRLPDAHHVRSCCWGIFPSEVVPGRRLWGYRHVIGHYRAGDASAALKRYLATRFPQDLARDTSIMVNPWGVGCFPKLVNERFLLDEIAAAAKLGATHYQIDDGWQQGRALRELTTNNRRLDDRFWRVDPQALPGGFDAIYRQATASGIELALWFAPSYNCEYRDWRRSAALLLDFHRKYGIRLFKLDAIKLRGKLAEANLLRLAERLRAQTDGAIGFNFDTTNGQRPGYFMALEYGTIFLENRYVCHEWGVGYHPEGTLANLWDLAPYVRTQTLQIEIPDHGAVNHAYYARTQRVAPDRYPPEYWAAIALVANPLLWLAPSRLSPRVRAAYRRILALHRKQRAGLFAGQVEPIGTRPDGHGITGFISHHEASGSGYLLLFRERAARRRRAVLELPALRGAGPKRLRLLHASAPGEARLDDSRLTVRLDAPASFGLWRYC